MSDDFSPDLAGLESDYQVLTELRRSERSRTYLGRHVGLNRDVSITVLAAATDGDDNSLTHFASDARILSSMRHPNVVPVVEARWLADGGLAVVRARVRGTTLNETIRFGEPLTPSGAAKILAQVDLAIEWARGNGIVHRHLPGEAVLIQQGSGRVLVELDLTPFAGGGYSDASVDARTIGQLAYAMLSGRVVGDMANEPLAELRPDLAVPVIRELSALVAADRLTPPRDPNVLITLLQHGPDANVQMSVPVQDAAPAPSVAAPPVVKPQQPKPSAQPAVKPAGLPAAPPAARPAAPESPGPVTESGFKRRFGFGARLIILAIVSTAVGAASVLLWGTSSPPQMVASTSANTAHSRVRGVTSAGEVTSRKTAPDSRPSPVAPLSPQRPTPVEPPATRFHEPLRGAPPATLPNSVVPTNIDSSAVALPKPTLPAPTPTKVADVCESAEAGDQRACMIATVEQADTAMNSAFQRLVLALRRHANVQVGDPDPPVVDELRTSQRMWIYTREATCRDAGEQPFYAKGRARCFADQSAKRTIDLGRMLDSVER